MLKVGEPLFVLAIVCGNKSSSEYVSRSFERIARSGEFGGGGGVSCEEERKLVGASGSSGDGWVKVSKHASLQQRHEATS